MIIYFNNYHRPNIINCVSMISMQPLTSLLLKTNKTATKVSLTYAISLPARTAKPSQMSDYYTAIDDMTIILDFVQGLVADGLQKKQLLASPNPVSCNQDLGLRIQETFRQRIGWVPCELITHANSMTVKHLHTCYVKNAEFPLEIGSWCIKWTKCVLYVNLW